MNKSEKLHRERERAIRNEETVKRRKPVFAEVSENGKKIEVYFPYDYRYVDALHALRGIFVPKDKGGPFWTIELNFKLAKRLSKLIGKERLELGAALKEWAWREKDFEDLVHKLVHADDGILTRLPEVLPDLAATLRADQRATVAYSAFVSNPLNGNQMGIGKTLEAIATVFEAGTEGPSLIIAPVTSAEDVWERELSTWQPYPILVATGEGMPKAKREEVLAEAQVAFDSGDPFWVVVNPDMLRLRKIDSEGDTTAGNLESGYPFLHEMVWNNVIADEFQKRGLRHPETVTAKGIYKVRLAENGKKQALSGTPLGGKRINLWGTLHFLEPDAHSSKWAWASHWLEIHKNEYGSEIGDIREGLEEEFDLELERIMVRHLKTDVLKDLPPKQYEEIWVRMTPKQKAQYKEFAKRAAIVIGAEKISATSILAEYTRLKQFADAVQDVRTLPDGSLKLTSLPDSGKLNKLLEKLEELGVIEWDDAGKKLVPVPECEEAVGIASQFTEVIDMVERYLDSCGIPSLKITGAVTQRGERKRRKEAFQAGGTANIMLLSTLAGGVSITLDRASNVFILDETWDPDDQEQLADRFHRASRIHQVTVWYLRSKGTIEEYIKEVTDEKGRVNDAVLNGRTKLKLI